MINRSPDKLPDPWLFDSESLLRDLDRCRERVLKSIAPENVKSEYGSVASRRSRHVPNESRRPTARADLQPLAEPPAPISAAYGSHESASYDRSYVRASSK